jgi:hypothetical protein
MSEAETTLLSKVGKDKSREADHLKSPNVDEKEPVTIRRLKELSKMLCTKCDASASDVCFDCRVHKLVNQLLNELI